MSHFAKKRVTKSIARDSPEQERVRAALEAAGCRWTRQRAAVYKFLRQVDTHPTAEEVYRAVRSRLPRISLATVYKALEALVEARLAVKLDYGDHAARYDRRAEDHYHLRDVSTGEVRDLPTPFDPALLEKLQSGLVDDLAARGFHVTGYRLEVLGQFER